MEQQTTDSAVVDGVTTPAETGAAEPTAPVTTPIDPLKGPWDDFGKGGDETVNESKTEEPETPEPAKEAEPKDDKPADDKPADEKPLEDQVLDELFVEGKPVDEVIEPKPEDDLDSQNPEEMQKQQRNKVARDYLARTEKYATPLKEFKNDKAQPIEVFQKLEPILGADKVSQLKQTAAHELVDTNPDATFQRAYAVKMLARDPNWDVKTAPIPSLDDIISGKLAPARADAETPSVDLSELTKGLSASIDWDWRNPELDVNFVDEREQSMAAAMRAFEAHAKAAEAAKQEAETKLTEAQTVKAETAKTDEQSVIANEVQTGIKTYESSITQKLLPYLQKNSGLEVSKDDTPEITAFKERHMKLYEGTEYERANGLPSRFQSFAENESSVKSQITDVYTRVVNAQVKAAQAKLAGNTAEMERCLKEADDERVPLFTLFAKANEEFKANHITPDLELLGNTWKRQAETANPEARPVELVSNAAPTHRPAARTYNGANSVWDSMIEDSAKEDRLAAGA
jgi:hypothetical protein